MSTVICFMEKDNSEVEAYINEHEEDMIHFYTDIHASCEGNMFFAFGELLSICLEAENAVTLITDDRALGEGLYDYSYPMISELIVTKEEAEAKSWEGIDIPIALDYESQVMGENFANVIPKRLLDIIFENDIYKCYDVVADLSIDLDGNNLTFKQEWLERFYTHFFRMLRRQKLSEPMWLNVTSYLMKAEHDTDLTKEYLKRIIDSPNYNGVNYYFIWKQFKRIGLLSIIEKDEEISEILDSMYVEANKAFDELTKPLLSQCRIKGHNKDVVVVLTEQLLGNTHAPSRTTMERVKDLMAIGKKVYLINTAEQYTIRGYTPLYNFFSPVYKEELSGVNKIKVYGTDEEVSFVQFDNTAPITQRVKDAVEIVMKVKPEYVLSIGSGSIVADMLSKVVPVASLALLFSSVPKGIGPMKIIGSEQVPEGKDYIPSRFTFNITKPAETNPDITREILGIPKDRFTIVIIGIRLDSELDDEFLKMLDELCKEGVFVTFAGILDTYQMLMNDYEHLAVNSAFVGFCDDILNLIGICELYVNPNRVGGGYSVIESFTMGKPAVYLNKGDVGVAGGLEFAVDNLEQMKETILKYKDDPEFYSVMSGKAVKRAELMTDSLSAIKELDERILERI